MFFVTEIILFYEIYIYINESYNAFMFAVLFSFLMSVAVTFIETKEIPVYI